MAKKTASKTSKKVDFNFEIDANTNKKINKQLKRTPAKTLLIALVVLLVGAAIGCSATFLLTRKDCFKIVGAEEITLTINQPYFDQGVKVVAFGKNHANKVAIETNLQKNLDGSLTSNEVGTFYIKYTVKDFKYGTIFKVQKIRLITFVEPSDDAEAIYG